MDNRLLSIINAIREKKATSSLECIIHDRRLRDDLGLDSLDLAELTVRLENEFGIDIFEDGIVETVGEILEKLEQSK